MKLTKWFRITCAMLLGALAVGFAEPSWAYPDDVTAKQKAKAAAKQALKQKLKELAEAKMKADVAAKPTPVRPATPPRPAVKLPKPLPPQQLAAKIDEAIDARLNAENIPASPRTTDEEFLRRVSLDLAGVIPTVNEARAFLASTDPYKREKLIDTLLASPGYGQHLADIWTARLFPVDSMNRFITKEPLKQWFKDEFNKNTSWQEISRRLITGSGPVDENPEVTFYLANRTIDKLTDAIGTHFLGQSVACAQCHNHPFNPMKQQEYWELAAFFSKVVPDRPKNPNMGGDNTKLAVKEGIMPTRQRDFFPEAAIKTTPRFLGGEDPNLDPREEFRPTLANWVASPDNPYFAKNMVNRTWALMFGQGLVADIDDLGDGSDATHPELLELLSLQFAANQFDLKKLYKSIALSETYQRSSKPLPSNLKDETLYSHNRVKVMMPEQLYDSLQTINQTAIEAIAALPAGPKGRGPAQQRAQLPQLPQIRPGANPRDLFVNFFLAGAEVPNQAEYEAGIPQALRLMNSRQNIANFPNAFRAFAKPGMTLDEGITELYLATLSRQPNDAERARMLAYLQEHGRDAMADIFWALTNSSEFVLIR